MVLQLRTNLQALVWLFLAGLGFLIARPIYLLIEAFDNWSAYGKITIFLVFWLTSTAVLYYATLLMFEGKTQENIFNMEKL